MRRRPIAANQQSDGQGIADEDTRSHTSPQLEDDVTEGKSRLSPFLHSLVPRMSPLLGNHQLDLVFVEDVGRLAFGIGHPRRRRVGTLAIRRHRYLESCDQGEG